MKRMLFNATQAEEIRVAIVDGQKLIDLDIESAGKEQRKSNIYKAVITRLEPSLEAAFVDYGEERHGFLPFKEISRSYFQPGVEVSRATIKEALREGQELIVQVDKDERGNKGAAMTTFVSLAGRYLVLMPNNPRGGGVSRRVEGDERAELRDVMDQLEVPHGMSLIARTAAIGRAKEELQWDLNYLIQLWRAIESAASDNVMEKYGSRLLYPEGNLVIRAVRDYFQPDIGEILIDTDDIFEQARQFMSTVMPANVSRIKRYQDDVPLFSRFQIEHQIESAYSRQVQLPSGGAIVIDHTEALVSVDVNSGRATRGVDIEETALKTNLEAAEEVARQLRLRDLGGLIVIDFIDMENTRNQREVENFLRDCLQADRARVQTSKISRFGLLELSRQRLRPALAETSYIPCPRCSGTGHIRSTESAALHILRILEEEAMKDNTAAVHAQVPVDVATFLLNEKREDIHNIEVRHKTTMLIIPNQHLETPQHEITRRRHDETAADDEVMPSYKMVDIPEAAALEMASAQEARPARKDAAVKGIMPSEPAPTVAPKALPAKGLFATLKTWLLGEPEEPVRTPDPKRSRHEGLRDGRRKNGRRGKPERSEQEGRENAREVREPKETREPRPARETRPPRPPREAATTSEPKKDMKPKEAREPREPRRPRKEAEVSPMIENEAQSLPVLTDEAALADHQQAGIEPNATHPSEENGRRRQRRGHRRLRDRKEDGGTEVATEQAADAPLLMTQEPALDEVRVLASAPATEAHSEEVLFALTPQTSPVAPEPVLVPEVAPVEATPLIATAAEEPSPAFLPEQAKYSPEPQAVLDMKPLAEIAASSGLTMVETQAGIAPQEMAAPATPRGRKKREKPVIADEPLMMVETQTQI